jgi:hypothetical protein
MDISQSKILVSVPTLTGYNTGATKKNIKNIRFDADGAVDILDEAGTAHTLNGSKGQFLDVQGKITIAATTVTVMQVYL